MFAEESCYPVLKDGWRFRGGEWISTHESRRRTAEAEAASAIVLPEEEAIRPRESRAKDSAAHANKTVFAEESCYSHREEGGLWWGEGGRFDVRTAYGRYVCGGGGWFGLLICVVRGWR